MRIESPLTKDAGQRRRIKQRNLRKICAVWISVVDAINGGNYGVDGRKRLPAGNLSFKTIKQRLSSFLDEHRFDLESTKIGHSIEKQEQDSKKATRLNGLTY